MKSLKVWVVDDDESMRWVLEKSLKGDGLAVQCFPGAAELFDALDDAVPDVLITDIRMPGVNGLELMERVRKKHPQLPVIITTAHSDLDSAVAAYKGGAFEYLPKPFDVDSVAALVQRAAARKAGESESAAPTRDGALLIGEAPAMQEVFRAIGRLSHSQITVLITGETGAGKELVARALHEHSPRAGKDFIAVNTAAIPKDLMESEFFGHERGAFTGAQMQRKGRFEQADGGTLFLDEIGEMPTDLQTRLLRVLSDGEFYRVGGTVPIKVDVRVITATNRDLEKEVAEGRFREDLYHRLNVIRVRIPPLREHAQDIPALARHFLSRAATELHTEPKRLGKDVLERLQTFSWPGNVRQLENVCRWLTVMAPGRDIHAQDLPPELQKTAVRGQGSGVGENKSTAPDPRLPSPDNRSDSWQESLRAWAELKLKSGKNDLLGEALPAFEKALIEIALAECNGERIKAAQRLGWGRNTLTRKIKELGLDD